EPASSGCAPAPRHDALREALLLFLLRQLRQRRAHQAALRRDSGDDGKEVTAPGPSGAPLHGSCAPYEISAAFCDRISRGIRLLRSEPPGTTEWWHPSSHAPLGWSSYNTSGPVCRSGRARPSVEGRKSTGGAAGCPAPDLYGCHPRPVNGYPP